MTFRSLLPFGHRRAPELTPFAQWDPFLSLHRDVNRAFDDVLHDFGRMPKEMETFELTPKLDISETDEALEVTVELPGVDDDDIDLEVQDNGMIIRGEKKFEKEKEDKKKGYHVMERAYGSFMRTIPFDFTVDPDAVEADFSKGVLKITIPRPAEEIAHTKKISIKTH
jgi:HSP20 family protein